MKSVATFSASPILCITLRTYNMNEKSAELVLTRNVGLPDDALSEQRFDDGRSKQTSRKCRSLHSTNCVDGEANRLAVPPQRAYDWSVMRMSEARQHAQPVLVYRITERTSVTIRSGVGADVFPNSTACRMTDRLASAGDCLWASGKTLHL